MRGFYRGSRPRGYRGPVPQHICPDTGEEVSYFMCASRCPKYAVHTEGDPPRCVYEYEELKSSGFYARTEEEWLDHLHDAEPETWQRLVEEKKSRERVSEEIEAGRMGIVGDSEYNDEEQVSGMSDESEIKNDSEDEGKNPTEDDEKDESVDEDDDVDGIDEEKDKDEEDEDESESW
jgi:hypothetical protein